jgi:DNA-binding NarL/FixJ family response regulator
MNPPRLRVLIAEDHPLFRSALVNLVAADSDCAPPVEAADGATALELIRRRRPDVALFDIEMPRLDGLTLVRALQNERLDVPVCLLTAYKDPALFEEAMSLGVRGYVLKETAIADIMAAIKTVAAGSAFISPSLANLLLERRHRVVALRKQRRGLELLSPAERRILKMIAVDKTSKEIAEELGISPRTVENHRANIAQKLDLHGVHSLVKFALGHRNAL